MGLGYPLGEDVQKPFAGLQALLCCGGKRRTVEVELPDLFEPVLKLLQIGVVLLKLSVGEFPSCRFLGDFLLEVATAFKKLMIMLVAVSIEAGNDLFLLAGIDCRCFQMTDSPPFSTMSFSSILRRRM